MKITHPHMRHYFVVAVLLIGAGLFAVVGGLNLSALPAAASSELPNNTSTPAPSVTITGTQVTRTSTITRTPTMTRTVTNTRTVTRTRTPLPTPGACGDWRHFPVPSSSNLDFLRDVDASSSTDVWAVGDKGSATTYDSLIMHWDGQGWEIVPSPVGITLRGVVAIAPNDAWAVGYTGSACPNCSETRTLHWDGTDWTIVPSPNVVGHPDYLYAVAASGPNDIWAVGLADAQSLTMHWDGTAWTIVPVPTPSGYRLNGVSVLSPTDAWAVGTYGYETYTIHWDGTAWSHVPSPNPGTYDNELNGVVAIAPNDVWAVGALGNGPVDYHGLAIHWDGTGWETVPVPGSVVGSPNTYGIHLHAVDADSTNEVWAVGRDYISSDTMSVILRWDGSEWSDVPHPDPSRSINRLYGVVAVAPGEAWAVGNYWSDPDSVYWALVERYGPSCGSPTPTTTGTPPTSTPTETMPTRTATGTAAATGTEVQSTATRTSTQVPPNLTATLGATFTATRTTTQVAGTGTVTATALATATSCPGVIINGALTLNDPTQAGRLNTLLDASTCAVPRSCPGVLDIVPRHYDAYTFVNTSGSPACFTVEVAAACLDNILIHSSAYLDSYDPDSLCQNYLADVGPGVLTNSQYSFTVPAGARFVVVVNELAPNLLCPNYTLRVSGPACPVPGTPAPTSTSIAPTLTLTPLPTVTLATIPTVQACSIEFSDVLPGNPFYDQIMCLSCMGIMSGYPDGTFRPNNEVTRGQLAKIVSNTAGFAESVPNNAQTFEDVPVGSTFYMYVERIAARNIIGGYSCGGPGEPCGPENRPYFRPGANATRGHISKIVSSAMQLDDDPPGQTFEDVPPTHTFYLWVERLAMHDMMSGYPCGAPGEPCGEGNRPYFRPQANATRGQVSKITGNGFYPNCTQRGR